MAEKIGLEAVMDMADFNKGMKQYTGGIDDMTDKTEKGSGIFSKLGGALTTVAKVGIGAAVVGFGALTAVIADSIGEAAAAQEAEAQLDAVLRSTGAAAAEQAKQWEAAQGKTVTSTRLSAAAIADLTSKLEAQKLKHNALGAAIQEQQQKVVQLTQQYGAQGLATLKAKARLEEMKAQYDDQGKSIDTLTDKIAKGGEKISVSLADKLGLVPPVVQMTKDEILKLADSLSKVTPFEDDLIVSTEAVLLQFKSLGRDVFPQATELALDLAQRLGIDAVSAAKMLGKALVEPGEGLARLKQAGVTFSEEQEKMIEKMVAAGDVAGAQKLIMDELEKSIGGAARAAGETFAGKMEILKNSIGNVKETIGNAFLPVLTQLADKFASFVQENGPQIEAFFQSIADWTINKLIPALVEIYNWIATYIPPAIQMLAEFWTNTLQPALAAVWEFIVINVIPILIEVYNWLATNLPPAIQTLSDFWTGTLQPALQAVWSFIQTNVIPIFQTVAGWFTKEGPSAIDEFTGSIKKVLVPIIQFMQEQFAWIIDWVRDNWPLIQKTIETVMTKIKEIVDKVLTAIKDFWEEHGDKIMAIVKSVWDIIKTIIDTTIKTIAGIIKAIMQAINGDWSGAWETIKKTLGIVWDGIKRIVNDAITIVKNELAIAWDLIRDAVIKAWDAIKEKLNTAWEAIKKVVVDAMTAIQTKLTEAWDAIWNIIDRVITTIKQGLIGAFNSIMGKVGEIVANFSWLTGWIGAVRDAFDWIVGAIRDVIQWLENLVRTIQELELPTWLTGGSPPPLAYWFEDIGEAVQSLADAALPDLQAKLNLGLGEMSIPRQSMIPAAAGAGQNVNVSFGDTTINSGLDASLFQAQVLQTVTRAVRGY